MTSNRIPYVVYLRDDDGSHKAFQTLKDHAVNMQEFLRLAMKTKAKEFEI